MGDMKERKIPVLTVMKNGAILKNIFVLNSPIPPPSSQPSVSQSPSISQSSSIQNPNNNNNKEIKQEDEEVVIVGRHPDCNIVLTHPSVSRFHLQINSIPFVHKLSLTDLGSVHGTWVSGNRIEPGVPVELAEGDTFKIGASTRVYRLHWVPLSCTYDTECSFVSALDMTICEDQEEEPSMEENAMSTEFKHADEKIPLMAKTCQKQNNFPVEKDVLQDETENLLSVENQNLGENNTLIAARGQGGMSKVVHSDNSLSLKSEEIQQLDSLLDGLDSLFSDDYAGSVSIEEIRLVPPVPENMKTICDEREEGNKVQYDHEAMETQPLISPLQYDKSNMISDCNVISFCSGIMNSLFSDETFDSVVRKVIPSAPPMPEDMTTPISNEKEEDQLFQYEDQAGEHQPILSPLPALKLSCKAGNQELLAERSMSELMNLDFAHYSENDCHLAEEVLEEDETWCLSRKDYSPGKMSTLSLLPLPTTEAVNSSNPVSDFVSENVDHKESQTPQSKIENLQCSTVKLQERSALGSIWTRRGKQPIAIQIQTDKSRRKTRENHAFVGAEQKSQENVENRSIKQPLFFGVEGTGHEGYTPDKENISPNSRLLNSQKKRNISRRKTRGNNNVCVGVEVNNKENFKRGSTARPLFSNVEIAEDEVYTPDKENFSPNTLLLRSLKKSGNKENFESRSTARSIFSNVGEAVDEVYTPDKENFSPNTHLLRYLKKSGKLGDMKNTTSSNLLPSPNTATFSMEPNENKENLRQEEGSREELYTTDKENFSPHKLLSKSLRKNAELGESKRSSRFSYSNGILSPSFQPELPSPDKENHKSKVIRPKSVKPALDNQMKLEPQIRETKGKAIERVPFQPLLENSASKSRPETSVTAATKSGNFIHCRQSIETKTSSRTNNINGDTRKSWIMLVDAASLINRESKKSLQLLQGLKGTKLLIPRMVIRELDSLKRQSSFFRRRTEVSSVLDWIELCMVETNWWIHVQTSLEEGRSIAATPPATPQSGFSDETGWFSNQLCSTHVSLMEVATPAAQDHILDYALQLRRTMKDGHLILLSNDITLKIKAMAEGFLCETAQEFQESLLNPFSERFLWTDSSPRGQTWSHLDDVVLREKYNHFPSRKSFKGEGAKGLKLILMHNSQYAKRTLAR